MDFGKRDVLGVLVDAVDMDGAATRVLAAARARHACPTTALAVHGIVEANRDQRLLGAVNNFDLVVPDGQPVRWALNLLYGLDLPDKVPGPSLVEALLERSADEGMAVHFYGSTEATLAAIRDALQRRYGKALGVSMEPSRFGRVRGDELPALAASINATGAQVCFVGLGCPRQERFVAAVGQMLEMPGLAVGAAFDYLAGTITRAPRLVQRAGLEWLYRTKQEPRRLAGRYLTTNTRFSVGVAQQWARQRMLRMPPGETYCVLTEKVPELVDA